MMNLRGNQPENASQIDWSPIQLGTDETYKLIILTSNIRQRDRAAHLKLKITFCLWYSKLKYFQTLRLLQLYQQHG